jgi:hypothetical protein
MWLYFIRLATLATLAVWGAQAAESVLTARAADFSANSRFGRFEIRAEVEGTVDLTLDGTRLVAEVFTGSKFIGAAATYTQPIPRAPFRSFRVVSIGAAKAKLVQEPAHSNGYQARVRISNKERRLANIRLLWESDGRFRGTPVSVAPGERNNALEGRMELTGRFANEVELRLRGSQVEADGPFVLQQLKLTQPLPAQDLAKLKKEGKVEIVDKPSAENRYTATIRVRGVKPEGEDRTIVLIWSR